MSFIELWRSEPVQLIQLIIPSEAAHDTVFALGELGLLQFRDLNTDKNAFQRTYANSVKRCEEMARRLRFFQDQVEKAQIVPFDTSQEVVFNFDELESRLDDLEKELLEINSNTERLQKSHSELYELQLVLEKASKFFEEARGEAYTGAFERAAFDHRPEIRASLLESSQMQDLAKSVKLGFIAGIVEQEKLHSFERLLFRVTRGNMFLRTVEVGIVVDPATGEKKEKSVFVVFFAGDRARIKINKICETFGANRYPFPEDQNRQRQMNSEVTARLRELQTTIDAGARHKESVLSDIAAHLPGWMDLVKKEKSVYHNLNKMSIDVTRKALVAEAWTPVGARERIHDALSSATKSSSAAVGTIFQPLVSYDQPPTYYNTHMFSGGFQAIVDAYGVARYREVNPTTWTIITFPFLFAVMFGDFGHAALMLVFALALIMNEKKMLKQQLNDMVDMAFAGRYVILLMGIFSVFTGLMYNEFFSMPVDIFGNQYVCRDDPDADPRNEVKCKSATETGLRMETPGEPYFFGLDPVWHGYETRTELLFTNSMKMKMSIVLGVTQMSLGVFMSLMNHIYFHDMLSIVCEFIPQILFLWSVFGYMCFIIIYKWVAWPTLEARSTAASTNMKFNATTGVEQPDPIGRPPDLYHIMIYFFLGPGSVDCPGEGPNGGPGCPENLMFDGQAGFQVFLLLLAFACIPWMLIPKPLILKRRHNQSSGGDYDRLQHSNNELALQSSSRDVEDPNDSTESKSRGGGGGGHGHDEEFVFSEVLVHQMIHTIEFVLGAVSNTASYLRLWALSLAHSQLSAVFYSKVLMAASQFGLDTGTGAAAVALFIGYFVWAFATIGVLLVMESLSAFLHALRLHWVEFQNKFYHGDGYAFTPFSFEAVLREEI
eukprot:TRINITY_DN1468_c0_g2_i1.p1 TRINITY_DN1468_c0_g2~~TRINITY_DN1468_c0_g2_i1.p1  ORF type:complete len:887 (+),score=191.34 TRINITY_DN1468_c0_g2_i1:21-2681(+)